VAASTATTAIRRLRQDTPRLRSLSETLRSVSLELVGAVIRVAPPVINIEHIKKVRRKPQSTRMDLRAVRGG
jgi:hypothetical protein